MATLKKNNITLVFRERRILCSPAIALSFVSFNHVFAHLHAILDYKTMGFKSLQEFSLRKPVFFPINMYHISFGKKEIYCRRMMYFIQANKLLGQGHIFSSFCRPFTHSVSLLHFDQVRSRVKHICYWRSIWMRTFLESSHRIFT